MPPLHITHAVLSLGVGGLERIVLSLVRAARRRGHRVSVVCVEQPGALAHEAVADGAEVVGLGKPYGRFPEYVGRAAGELARLKPDVIHCHHMGAAWYLGQAARTAGGPPVLHTEHGNEFARAPTWRGLLKARLFFRRAAEYVDRFCCVSDEIKAAVTRWRTVPRWKVEVIHNGIPTDRPADPTPPGEVRASLGIPPGAPVVGTVGRLTEVKCQDQLIRAVARLRGTVPGVHLLLVGDGEERARLEAVAAGLGADWCHFAGYQSRPERYLAAMTAFALTSRTEGFPVALLEAWLAGVPAVCSAVGAIPGVVADGEDGLLFPAGDEAALVAALARVLTDPGLGGRLAEAGGRAVRERYSLDRMAAEYERRYRELVAARRGVG